jgi:DtxR family Mn-dependent transcriptional regulator
MSVTPVAKEYLLAIHALAEEGTPAIGARLSERLKVSPPTVTETLGRLRRAGLIEMAPRRGTVLTSAGREIVEEMLRRQRLSERWLVEVLGLDWAEAHAASHAMEAAISPRIAERLSAILGHPTTCPHGNPIDEAVEDSAADTLVTLDRIGAGEPVVLERIAEEGEHANELLNYMERSQLRPGSRLVIEVIEPWAQTLTLRADEEQHVLGMAVAHQLWVRRLTAAELEQRPPEPSECPDEEAFVAEVTAVDSECPAGHQVGDRFAFGQRTPCGMCGEAFVEIHPHLQELQRRGQNIPVSCPEHGNVTFNVRLA